MSDIPVRTELTVLSTDPADTDRKIGFFCYEIEGTDVIRPPAGYPNWPPTSPLSEEVVRAWFNDLGCLITTEDGLVDGEELLIQDLFGLNIGVVSLKDGHLKVASKTGMTSFMLKFVHDRAMVPTREHEPPRWVATGSISLGLKRIL